EQNEEQEATTAPATAAAEAALATTPSGKHHEGLYEKEWHVETKIMRRRVSYCRSKERKGN
ncbi:hypothetical protein SK128_022935, partial [Halocaridina rubra]